MLSESINIRYIADHINRIETRHVGKPHLIRDSIYRVASNADILKGSTLTDEEYEQTLEFIEMFKSTTEGAEALRDARENNTRQLTHDELEHMEDMLMAYADI